MSIRAAVVAACAIVSATVLTGIFSTASGLTPLQSGTSAATAATGADARLAPAAAVSAVRRCPAASYGAHYYAPGQGKTVALTFDDGPGRTTAAVLRVLPRWRAARGPPTGSTGSYGWPSMKAARSAIPSC